MLALSLILPAYLSALTLTISGTVTSTSGGTPIPNHVVGIQDSASTSFVYFTNVTTDANGYYTVTIPNVPTGTFFVVSTLDCNSYYNDFQFAATSSSQTVNFQICNGPPASFTVIVSGVVTNTTNGNPVPNHLVEIQDTMNSGWSYYNSVYTNASGVYTFTIPNVPPNTWFWLYTRDCNYALHSMIVNGNLEYCYGFNFQICYNVPTITVNINGTVTDIANGSPVPNHAVVVMSDSSSGGYTYYTQLTTNTSGYYTVSIPNVPQGTTFNVLTYDCNNNIHQQTVNGNNTPITVNFQICTGTQTLFLVYGLVSAGNNMLDAGQVQLLRIDSLNTASVFATYYIQDTAAGHYMFYNVPAGYYYIKAIPADSSIYFGQYTPTYYDSTTYWTNAHVIQPQYNTGYCDIHLVPLNSYNSGTGGINGTIMNNSKTSIPMANVEVLLLDQDNHPLTYTFTDGNGAYSFQNLAFGTYIVYPEITKITTIPYTVTLDASNPNATVNFILENEMITTGIKEIPVTEISSVSEVYPNPASEQARINLTTVKELLVTISILNSMGQAVNEQQKSLQQGGNTIILTVSNLPAGVYYLRVQDSKGQVMKKFIIIK